MILSKQPPLFRITSTLISCIPPPALSAPRQRSRSSDFHYVHYPSVLLSPPFPCTNIFTQTTPNFFSYFTNTGLTQISLAYKIPSSISPPSWMTANLLTSVPPRLNSYSLEIGKIHNTTLTTTHSARNLGSSFCHLQRLLLPY